MRKFRLFIFILLICIFTSACSKNYKSAVYEYNNTVFQVNHTLKNYYKSLFDANRNLYFQSKYLNKTAKISFEDMEKPENAKLTVVNENDLKIRIEAIDTLTLYSNYLTQIYNDDLKNLTVSSVEIMISDIIKYQYKNTDNINQQYIPIITSGTSAILNKFLEKRRYNILKKYVNATNDTIVELLGLLDDETINVLQNNIELRSRELLKDQIIYYNRYLSKEDNDSSIETLRKLQLKEIQENYTCYDNIRKNNPQNVIKAMLEAQSELYNFVNNNTKSELNLLNVIQKIQKSVIEINRFLP